MSSPHPESHERAYLAELMQDFPAGENLDVDDALRRLSLRYKNLAIKPISEEVSRYNDDTFSLFFSRLPKQIHHFLYAGILSNAGSYRLASERDNGVVFFGRNQRFRGNVPAKLENEVKRTFVKFSRTDSQPVYTAVEFYQRFVYSHPFYDANGRIGRFIVTVYLDYHNYFISWEQLHRNSKWLKKLNDCHVRYRGNIYDEYVQRLVEHWSKCIIEKTEILPQDDALS